MNTKTLFLALCLLGGATVSLQAQATNEEIQIMYLSFLEEKGISGTIDGDGDVQFTVDDFNYFLGVNANDPEFFRLVIPNIWPIESEAERLRVLEAMDIANAQVKVAKMHLVGDNVWVGVENLQSEIGDFENYFDRSIELILQCMYFFQEEMQS